MLYCSASSEYNTHLREGAWLAQVSEKVRSTIYIYIYTCIPECRSKLLLEVSPLGSWFGHISGTHTHCAGRIAARHVATQELLEQRMPNRRVRMARRACRSTDRHDTTTRFFMGSTAAAQPTLSGQCSGLWSHM